MRLFTGFWPPVQAVDDLSAAMRALPARSWNRAADGLTKFRLIPPEQWHLTLCFHGEADPETVRTRLNHAVRDGLPRSARLRLARTGMFRGVLWIGVEPAETTDAAALRQLAQVAGADPSSFRAHVTIARWRSGRAQTRLLGGLFADYAGPWWWVDEITLISSEQRDGAPAYRAVHRIPLAPASSREPESSGQPESSEEGDSTGERGGLGADC